MGELKELGIDVLAGVLITVGTVAIPYLGAKIAGWFKRDLSAKDEAALKGFFRTGVLVAANEAKRRVKGGERPTGASLEEFAKAKAKAAAKRAGSKLLEKLSEEQLDDGIRQAYEEHKAEQANRANLDEIVTKIDATTERLKKLDAIDEMLLGWKREKPSG